MIDDGRGTNIIAQDVQEQKQRDDVMDYIYKVNVKSGRGDNYFGKAAQEEGYIIEIPAPLKALLAFPLLLFCILIL